MMARPTTPDIEDNGDHKVYTINHDPYSPSIVKLYSDGTCYIDVSGRGGLSNMGCGDKLCGDKHTEELLDCPFSFTVLEPFIEHSFKDREKVTRAMIMDRINARVAEAAEEEEEL